MAMLQTRTHATDIVNFTRSRVELSPNETVHLLNDFFFPSLIILKARKNNTVSKKNKTVGERHDRRRFVDRYGGHSNAKCYR
jgi:hypothetical protein